MKNKKTVLSLIIIKVILLSLFCGCWDNRELNDVLIITGIALDKAKKPEDLNITLQIGIESNEKNATDQTEGSDSSVLILETVNDTIAGAINEFNRNSNHKLIVQHNQIRLYSDEIAKKGLRNLIDLQMRDHQVRLEIPLLIVEGDAGEALKAKLDREPRTGMFLNEFLNDLSKISKKYKVRLIDFVSMLLEDNASATIPTIKVEKKGKKEEIKLTGFAVFKDDKMVGTIDNDQGFGYICARGDVKKTNFKVECDKGKAVLRIDSLKTKQKYKVDKDNNLSVNLNIKASVSISELNGFKDMQMEDLVPKLKELGEKEIKDRILEVYQISKDLEADILCVSKYFHQSYPKQWKKIKDDWQNIYQNSKINVKVDVKIQGTGQIVQSLEMEEKEVER